MKVDLRRSFTAVQGDFDFQEGIDRALQPDQRNDVAFRERDGVHAGEREALEAPAVSSVTAESIRRLPEHHIEPSVHASRIIAWKLGRRSVARARALRFSSVSPTFPARELSL